MNTSNSHNIMTVDETDLLQIQNLCIHKHNITGVQAKF